jgi:hypothetical protein
VNHFEQRERVPNFVFLEMSNEMPSQVRGKFRNLSACFLHAAFTEQSVSSFNHLLHPFCVVGFRNRYKVNLITGATGFHGSLSDLFANPFKIFGDCAHGR